MSFDVLHNEPPVSPPACLYGTGISCTSRKSFPAFPDPPWYFFYHSHEEAGLVILHNFRGFQVSALSGKPGYMTQNKSCLKPPRTFLDEYRIEIYDEKVKTMGADYIAILEKSLDEYHTAL